MTVRNWSFAILLALMAVGCGGSSTNESTGPTANETAKDVAAMLLEYHAATKKTPTRISDLTDAEATHPVGHAAVASQDYIVFWRVPISASGSDTVLAYYKDVPTTGGSVVMQDGSTKEMTAEEFNAAPKAKK